MLSNSQLQTSVYLNFNESQSKQASKSEIFQPFKSNLE